MNVFDLGFAPSLGDVMKSVSRNFARVKGSRHICMYSEIARNAGLPEMYCSHMVAGRKLICWRCHRYIQEMICYLREYREAGKKKLKTLQDEGMSYYDIIAIKQNWERYAMVEARKMRDVISCIPICTGKNKKRQCREFRALAAQSYPEFRDTLAKRIEQEKNAIMVFILVVKELKLTTYIPKDLIKMIYGFMKSDTSFDCYVKSNSLFYDWKKRTFRHKDQAT